MHFRSVKDKAQHAVILDKTTSDKLYKDVQSYRLVTVATLVDRLKINGSLARRCLKDLEEKGQIKQIVGHSKMKIYSMFGLPCGKRCRRNNMVLTIRQLVPLLPPSKYPTDITSTDLTGGITTWLTAVRLGLRLFGHGFVSGNGSHFAARCSIGSEVLQILRLESHQDTNKRRGSVLSGPECDQQPNVLGIHDVRASGRLASLSVQSGAESGQRRRSAQQDRIDTLHLRPMSLPCTSHLRVVHGIRGSRLPSFGQHSGDAYI